MPTINFDKSYSQKSNATRDMKQAIAAGQFAADQLEVVVVPSGWQIVRTETEAPATNVVPLRMPEPEKVVAPEPEAVAIRVRYATVDGVNKSRSFKTLAAARKFAQQWVGPHPEIGTGYAVAGDGVGKVTVEGAKLADLFPEDAQPEAEKVAAPELAAKPTAAPSKTADVTDNQAAYLRALANSTHFSGPAEERADVWVLFDAVHESRLPHGLSKAQMPGLTGALRKRGLIDVGWSHEVGLPGKPRRIAIRITRAGLTAAGKSV